MSLDDPETIRRFISHIKGKPERSNLTSPPSTQHNKTVNEHGPKHATSDNKHVDEDNKSKGAVNSPHAHPASQKQDQDQDQDHWTSPETQPKPSPQISGLKAPHNTPKTATSSPRLLAANTHNEDIAETISDCVNTMHGRPPLSECIWAPGSARYKPSMLSEARSSAVLTPIRAVEPNPAINDTFDRMSFKAAESDNKVDGNLIGDHITRSLFSKAPPSENKVDEVQAKPEATSHGDFEPPTHTETATEQNEAPSALKAYVPPHLRATRSSSQQSDSSTRVPVAVKDATKGAAPKLITGPVSAKPLKGESEGEDLERMTVFRTWPKQEERSRPAAKVRTVIIKNLPRGSTATFVASLVHGGTLEEIHIRSSAAGDVSATIRFMDAGACLSFYDKTSNGLVYGKDAKGDELVLSVEMPQDVDVVGGLLQGWIASGVTRCVRAVGVGADWGMDGLEKMAERKNRKVEKIVDGQNPGGARSVTFRFCRVEDAVQFKAALSRDEEWEHCNIHYAVDPCAAAAGVHFG